MAKVHLDRLRKKYKNVPVSGNTYANLVTEIIDKNTEAMNKGMARIAKDKMEIVNRKIKRKEKRLVLPPEDEVIPKRSLHVLKSAEKSQLIRDSLRDRLTKDLRKSLFESDTPYLKKRGVTAGRINPKLIEEFESNIGKTFKNYTKRNPKFGMPKNIHTIAVTEVRSSINNIKREYANRLIEHNPHINLEKKWIHNPALSINPRRSHAKVNQKKVPYEGFFKVPVMESRKGRMVQVGTIPMSHPHDPGAPADQVINCHCDYDILVKI